MHKNVKDYVGTKFNMLTVVSFSHTFKGRSFWNAICECGGKTVVASYTISQKKTKSCGCLIEKQYEKQRTSEESKIKNGNKRLSKYRNSEKGQATIKAYQEKYSKTKARKESIDKCGNNHILTMKD